MALLRRAAATAAAVAPSRACRQARRCSSHNIPYVPRDPMAADDTPVDPPSARPGLGKWAEVIPRENYPVGHTPVSSGSMWHKHSLGYIDASKAEKEVISHFNLDDTPLLTRRDRAWLNVRGPADTWECPKCATFNPKGLADCESCGHTLADRTRPTTRQNAHWICGKCLYPNYLRARQRRGSRIHGTGSCKNCNASQTHALRGTYVKGLDWVCEPCKVINNSELCTGCGQPALGSNEFEPFSRAGTWWCSECDTRNFKSNKKCSSCGYWK